MSKLTALGAAVATMALVAIVTTLDSGLGPSPGTSDSHREAPLVSAVGSPTAASSSTRALVAVDLVANRVPLEEPAGGVNQAERR